MVKLYSMKDVAFVGTNWNPESRPVALKFEHGDANVDWVMVWFLLKLNNGWSISRGFQNN